MVAQRLIDDAVHACGHLLGRGAQQFGDSPPFHTGNPCSLLASPLRRRRQCIVLQLLSRRFVNLKLDQLDSSAGFCHFDDVFCGRWGTLNLALFGLKGCRRLLAEHVGHSFDNHVDNRTSQRSIPISSRSVTAALRDDGGPRAVIRSPSTLTDVAASSSASHVAPAAFTSSSTQ